MNQRLDKLLKMNEIKQTDFTLFALAKEYEQLGDQSKALEYYSILEHQYPAITGFYYHFAKLLFELGDAEKFKRIVAQGKQACESAKDKHALSELMGLYQECIDDDE